MATHYTLCTTGPDRAYIGYYHPGVEGGLCSWGWQNSGHKLAMPRQEALLAAAAIETWWADYYAGCGEPVPKHAKLRLVPVTGGMAITRR